jgi:hypothetical protein
MAASQLTDRLADLSGFHIGSAGVNTFPHFARRGVFSHASSVVFVGA